MDERAYLKVKIKSLAAEAKIIRKETKRAKRASIRDGLALHRKGIVRTEARHTHLAYGFLRGREYRQMERTTHEAPDWDKVRKMVDKYGSHLDWSSEDCGYSSHSARKQEVRKRFEAWLTRAMEPTKV
ncbi:MAG: hypothetical protein V3T23_09055 [Nitrososphaerales archaeon]